MDIDLDFGTRDGILDLIPHTKAAMVQNGKITQHVSGIYVTPVPTNLYSNQCIYDYKTAEELGYFKIDFLNNSLYTHVTSRKHLQELAEREPEWKRLKERTFVRQIIHISAYYHLLRDLPEPITSIEHMAMFLALLRPGKKQLMGKPWHEVEKVIWEKDPESGYQFKKSHSFGYALACVVNMNLVSDGVNMESDFIVYD